VVTHIVKKLTKFLRNPKFIFVFIRLPNAVGDWLTFLLRIRQVLGSNLDPHAGYSDCFRGFLSPSRKIPGHYLTVRPRPLHSTSFPIHLHIILSFDATYSELRIKRR
jgi:hypothetical protein